MILIVDFNDVDDDETLWALTDQSGFEMGRGSASEGGWVELRDHDGMSCMARVTEVRGSVIRCRINWATRRTITPNQQETTDLKSTGLGPDTVLVSPPPPSAVGF
jgi:hypothetical protein